MTKTDFSSEIFSAATLHLDILGEFTAIVQGKLAATDNAFARDSLTDLLASLTDQRDSYMAFAVPMATAA